MSHYSDAEESIHDDISLGVRKRQPLWDSDTESMGSEIKVSKIVVNKISLYFLLILRHTSPKYHSHLSS